MKISVKNWLSQVGIVVIAALLVEIISVVQYQRLRSIMEEEIDIRSSIVQGSISAEIGHILELTEATMRENLWELQRYLHHPDSIYPALVYLIDDNPNVVGGCLSFLPDYYPSKGRLYEPYASKQGGGIVLEQIAGPDHDYTQNPAFQAVAESGKPDWSDPYLYGPDSLSLITYSYPVPDDKGRLAAVCGLDMDLSWLGDTLNAKRGMSSSFILVLTQDHSLVAGPPASLFSARDVQQAQALIREGKLHSPDNKVSIRVSALDRDPHWQVAQVYNTNELLGPMRKMRRQQVFLVFMGLLILFFMINRIARNAKKLREATAEQARIAGELSVAGKIQQDMIPDTFTPEIYGCLEPALEVGGDLFDFYVRDGKLMFCMGDVSGKGVPAAMLMSMVHSLFRMVSMKMESPSSVLYIINDQICRGNYSSMFVTFQMGCLDLYTGQLHIANAGHDKPFLLTSSASMIPLQSNLPLGVFQGMEFKEETYSLSPGTCLFLYTDGLTEAKNLERKAFGRERVEETLNACLSHADATPQRMVGALSTAAHRFAGSAPQSDDIAMLMIKYSPEDFVSDHIVLRNNQEDVVLLSQFIKDYCATLELDNKTMAGLRLALEESVVNVMNYAYPAGEEGEVEIFADSNRREVRFTVMDRGVPFDPTSVLSADTTQDAQSRPIGGLGVLLTRKLMDSVSYCRRDGKNVLTLTKSIL